MNNNTKQISAKDFIKLNFKEINVVDLREKDELLVRPFSQALNFPFSSIWENIDDIPKDKPVYVFCHSGELSTEIVSILTERGYDAVNVEGGYSAVSQEIVKNPVELDAKNVRCPSLIIKVADTVKNVFDRQHIIVEATESSFASDIAVWCERTGNKLISIETKNDIICAEIEKNSVKTENKNKMFSERNDKNFLVFSCDLDKTIAAFIMANGAAAMGRKVTMFFTFWGLNILRKEEYVPVEKNFIEKMFSFLMPKGTKKLKLSRLNMCGMGAKIIRKIMQDKEIKSLEDLVHDAVSHGVKLVACQMTMDVMGIKKEELLDGVETGGVATFLGAGEKSDMSLFI